MPKSKQRGFIAAFMTKVRPGPLRKMLASIADSIKKERCLIEEERAQAVIHAVALSHSERRLAFLIGRLDDLLAKYDEVAAMVLIEE